MSSTASKLHNLKERKYPEVWVNLFTGFTGVAIGLALGIWLGWI